jgi:hypothetical protein
MFGKIYMMNVESEMKVMKVKRREKEKLKRYEVQELMIKISNSRPSSLQIFTIRI